jgi:methionyl-tRNA synthetase
MALAAHAPPPRFFVTTPIYYVNAAPHLGTFYTTVVGDALARYHRARGHETFFLTGTDEHGQKIERMAKEKGVAPQAYCDGIVAEFKKTWARVGISYDRFIRTTDDDHLAAVAEMWQRIWQKGDIYAADYEGWYCVGCEDWKTDEETLIEGDARLCPTHRKPVERVKEKNYFFKLSKYADRLLELYQRPGFVRPESRRNEVAEFVKAGLRDISVSRLAVKWGIPVPGDPKHTIYVWIDALTNYLSALGGPSVVATGAGRGPLWADAVHLIAKDILRFHAVYWPALLMSAELPPPKGVFCHGYLTVKGEKISKSLPATRVDPNAVADELGVDPLRYFVLREYTFGADGDFTYETLLQRYESDLGNDLGNLVNRTLAMAKALPEAPDLPAHKPRGDAADPLYEEEIRLRTDALAAVAEATRAWDDLAPGKALDATWAMIRRANTYIDRTAPWKLGKAGQHAELRAVLANTCEVIRRAALLVAPAMPHAAAEILRQIGRTQDAGTWPDADEVAWPGARLESPQPIFPRLDPDRQAALITRWTGGASGGSTGPVAAAPAPAAAPASAEIALDDFARVELRAARVLTAKKIEKADKLLELTVDVGEAEPRTVVSGIARAYDPAALVGRTVILLANLKAAKIRGVPSRGMILAAGEADVLALATLDRDVPPGTKIR